MEIELSAQIPVKRFKKALLACLDETFSNVQYDIVGALSILVHTAYHLGGIRQALGAITAGTHA
jgi:hypothetical protein